jgi:hypothetical protein
MPSTRFFGACCFALVLAFTPCTRAAAPEQELASFTDFKNVDPAHLGRIVLSQRGKLLSMQDGLMTETCYLVAAPTEKTLTALVNWDPASHADLGVAIDGAMRQPVQYNDFAALRFDISRPFIQRLYNLSVSLNPEKSELNLSRAEAASLVQARERARRNNTSLAEALAVEWRKILFNRTEAFQQGGAIKLPPYEMGGKTVKPGTYFLTMLAEQPRVAAHFSQLLRELPLQKKSGPNISANYYWGLFKPDDTAAFHAGGVFSKKIDSKYQVADIEFYVSNTYYLGLTLYSLWPVTVNGAPATLVWRGDYFAAPTLSFTRGIERMAYAAVMAQEIKKSIRHFQDDVEKKK